MNAKEIVGILVITLVMSMGVTALVPRGVSTDFSNGQIPSWLEVTNGTVINKKLVVNRVNNSGYIPNNATWLKKTNGTYTDLSLIGLKSEDILGITYSVSVELNYNFSKWNSYYVEVIIFNKNATSIYSNGSIFFGYSYAPPYFHSPIGSMMGLTYIDNSLTKFIALESTQELQKKITFTIDYQFNGQIKVSVLVNNTYLSYSFNMKDTIKPDDIGFKIIGDMYHRSYVILLKSTTTNTVSNGTFNITSMSILGQYKSIPQSVVINNVWWIVLIIGIIVVAVAVIFSWRYFKMH